MMGKSTEQEYTRVRRRTIRSRVGIVAVVGATCFGAIATAGSTASAAAAVSESRVREDDAVGDIAVTALADLQSYAASGDPSILAQYGILRDGIATALAARLGVEASRMITAWQAADLAHQTALMAAFTQLGVPYRSMASKPNEGFDCSGLTTYAWGVAGVTLIRQSGGQIRAAAARTQATAMAGDLVYYPGHVMLWLGVDQTMVHAPYTGRNVEVDTVAKRRSVRFGNPIG
jgi:cell wall-associated NlpC family hydrolase